MQDFTLDKGKIAMMVAGLFCLYAVYGAVSEFKLPSEAQAIEPAQQIIELDPVNIQLLTKTHLFGRPPEALVAAAKKVNANRNKQNNNAAANRNKLANQNKRVNTKPIKINVTVTGLLASNDEDFAAAMLKVDNKPEKLYRVGEDLGKPEVKLQSVELESVIIDNNGNEQTIAMKRPGLESSNKRNNNQSNNNSRNTNLVPAIPADLNLPPEPDLELPEELQMLNTASFDGAYTPPMPTPVDIDQPPIPEELEEELLQRQIEDELDEDIRAALEETRGNIDPNGNPENAPDDHGGGDDHDIEDFTPPLPDAEASVPNFQMPVF